MRLANMLLLLNKARSFLDRYKAIDANMLSVVSRHLWLRMQGKSILAHPSSVILGLKNIDISGGTLRIGMNYVGFAHSGDVAFLNIGGGRCGLLGMYQLSEGAVLRLARMLLFLLEREATLM